MDILVLLYYPVDHGLCPGKLFSTPRHGGAFIAGEPEIRPQLVDFTSTAVVIILLS